MVQLSKGANRIYGEAAFEVLAKAQALERQGKNINIVYPSRASISPNLLGY